MSDFKLDDPGSSNLSTRRSKKKRSFAARLMDWGIVSNEQQANLVLIIFVVIAFVAIVAINMNTFSSSTPVNNDDYLLDEDIDMM